MSNLERICVFCGASPGARPAYLAQAQALATELASRGLPLVYGGGNVGLMGALADATLQAGGQVIGVIPEALKDKELAHHGLTELHVVSSMHERKAKMAELASAFIALPGGMGTLEELFEILTWAQLGFHDKPIGLLDVDGYYEGLLRFLDHSVREEFVSAEHRTLVQCESEAKTLLERFNQYQAPTTDKWLGRSEL